LEAWEKVLIKPGSSGDLGELDPHLGVIACWDCHGGDPLADDPETAHEGLVADPAGPDAGVCAGCHAAIEESFRESMHFRLWGKRHKVAQRTDYPTFDDCPAQIQEGFRADCAKCHAGCGDCHVSRPDQAGKGFIDSHRFKGKPHQKNQCMACHGSRIGADFMGDDEAGCLPDAHFAKGKSCMSCHDAGQMHAAEEPGVDRYHLSQGPACEGCHDVADKNDYHMVHWDTLSCHVCHAQPYNNCAGCHVSDAWQKDPVYQENNPSRDLRIGLNPVSDRRFKYATVRHAPMARDTYDNWGIEGAAPAFDDYPTWRYTTPHSVRRWTERTSVEAGIGCGANCHLGEPSGSMDNLELYLYKEFVESNWPDEVKANGDVIIDGELPAGWWQEQ